MPFVRDFPTRIPVPGQFLQLICVDVNRAAPLLYLAHESSSGLQVYTAELSWPYVVTNPASLSSSAPISVNLSASGSVGMGFVHDIGGAVPGSLSTTRR